MDIQPFFTEEEKKQFFSKYKQLLRHLYSFLKKEDLSKMKELMKRVVALDCYGRDKNGINGLLRNIDTALIATTEIGLKRTSVIALLLYRPVMKKIITLDEVKTTFDADVTLIISRLLKTSDLYARNTAVDSENFHKLLFSFAEDVRVILIMIADRLCLMRLGKQLKNDEDRKRLATEVSYLYAPLAHRLGLYTIKSELEDLCMKYRFPQQYAEITQKLNETEASRQEFISKFNAPIIAGLNRDNINYEISGRVKSVYSIWSKMQRKQIPFEEIYDLFAIRIVFKPLPFPSEKTQCWQVYSTITDIYTPKPDRLRDWIFSRQRYWGEPIPVIHWDDGTTSLVPEDELPLKLPDMKNIEPSGTGESPLANATDWINVYDENGRHGLRETNTMPQWAGSSWYWLRYTDPHNEKEFASKEALDYWSPVDLYVGGAEHAVLHLLYARFWHKVLYDLGYVPTPEPFMKLVNQGMILGSNHEKMSKSKGNVVNPDDIVEQYGADTLRLYEMFMGPLTESVPWDTKGLHGAYKWINRVWRLMMDDNNHLRDRVSNFNDGKLTHIYNQTVKKVTEDFERMHFNTAISQLMVFVNEAYKVDDLPVEYMEGLIKMISPVIPHVAEELWSQFHVSDTIAYQPWPTYDPKALEEATVEMIVQVNGKVRARIEMPKDADKETAQAKALANEHVQKFIEGKEIKKVIVVPNHIVNIVVK